MTQSLVISERWEKVHNGTVCCLLQRQAPFNVIGFLKTPYGLMIGALPLHKDTMSQCQISHQVSNGVMPFFCSAFSVFLLLTLADLLHTFFCRPE